MPLLAGRYRIAPGAAARAVFGTESKGLSALLAAASHPEVFGKVAVQSLWFGPTIRQSSRAMPRPIYQSALEALRTLAGDRPTVYMDWAAAEMRSRQLEVDITADNVELARTLRQWGYRVLGGQYPGGLQTPWNPTRSTRRSERGLVSSADCRSRHRRREPASAAAPLEIGPHVPVYTGSPVG